MPIWLYAGIVRGILNTWELPDSVYGQYYKWHIL